MLFQKLLKIFYIFPVNQKCILFSSFEGRQYSDNPKYLYLYISEKYDSKYKYIWVLNKTGNEKPGCKTVKFLSLSYFYYLLTSKFIISNLGIEPFFPKRKQQVFINTWHGSGAYKKVEIKGSSKKSLIEYQKFVQKIRAKNTNFYISGCKRFSEVMAESWKDEIGKFIQTGLPRNDILFKYSENLKKDILNKLSLSADCMYVLFAPTFRGDSYRNQEPFSFSLDIQTLLNECERKWKKKCVCLYRTHIGAVYIPETKLNVINVSDYSDIQELLLISDILVTDYSSCMWDFAIMKRPAFLYTPDIEQFMDNRGFYTPIEDWPFQISKTNEDLIKKIQGFSIIENEKRITKHFTLLESFETGMASEMVCSILKL